MNQPPVTAESKGMASLGPSQVIHDVVDRNIDHGAARYVIGIAGGVVEKAKGRVVALADPAVAEALAYQAIANVIHDMGSDRPSLAHGDAFAIVLKARGRRISGEILDA